MLHLKAALLCALGAIVLALPILWVPLLPAWSGWRPPVANPPAEAILAVIMAAWVAWCVVDIPRRGLKVLVWLATLWLLGSGIWLAGLYGYPASSLVPLTAAGLAGAGALAFSFSPAGSRRARWETLVGGRVSRDFLRSRVDEVHLSDEPRAEDVVVAEVLWPAGVSAGDEAGWARLEALAQKAGEHFQKVGGYLERCDAEGAVFLFGCWGQEAVPRSLVGALWQWVQEAGGCAALTRGRVIAGVGRFPDQVRWTVAGEPLRRARRLAAAARSYACGVLLEEEMLPEVAGFWRSRRMIWWEFEGEKVLLHEITGSAEKVPFGVNDDLRRWNLAWDCFWSGRWAEAEKGFAALVRENNDRAARVFALRSQAARRRTPGA